MGKYLIFDEETQIHVSHKRKANPFHPDNYVVARGWKKEGDIRCSARFFDAKTPENILDIPGDVEVLVGHNIKFDLLYEMCNDNQALRDFYKRGGRIWCTQYAEYLLNAQARKFHMNSMDQIIESYGGRKKIDGMKALWDAGVQTSDIDPAMVLDYLIGTEEEGRNSGDIGNTELIYLGQLELAESLGMTAAIKVRMDGLCGTTEMEYNGIKVDIEVARTDLKRLHKALAVADKDLNKYIKDIPEAVGFKWSSVYAKSCIIYGGTLKYQRRETYTDPDTGELARKKATEKWPLFKGVPIEPGENCVQCDETGFYFRNVHCTATGGHVQQDVFLSGKKEGEPKFKNVSVPGELKKKNQDFFYSFPGYVDPNEYDIKSGKLTDGKGKPIYSTDSDTIELLGNAAVPFLVSMAKKTTLDKEIGTYYVTEDPKKGGYKGMLTCVSRDDHIVHHSLNHTSTVTTRLSSSNPNLQNIPRADMTKELDALGNRVRKSRVKAMFRSRFPNGVMGEADYSQLEVVVQGLLSKDVNLCNDLINKIDFHCKRVAIREGCTYEQALYRCKDEAAKEYDVWNVYRTECKIFSFQRAYGAGAATIALTANMKADDVKDMIKKEEAMYPDVVTFNTRVETEVNKTAEPFADGERGYRTFRKGTWQAPTGTLYGWRSWDAPKFMRERGIMDTFSPPELKNYPVQGTGGEIVQMVIGVLWRWFVQNDNFGGKALLINTVHDCIWFDMQPEVVDEVLTGSKKIMEAVPQMLKKFFGLHCPVPFPVDVEIGEDMLDMKHWEAGHV